MGSERTRKEGAWRREPGSLARAGRRGEHAQVPEPGHNPQSFPKMSSLDIFLKDNHLEYSVNHTTSLEDPLVWTSLVWLYIVAIVDLKNQFISGFLVAPEPWRLRIRQ